MEIIHSGSGWAKPEIQKAKYVTQKSNQTPPPSSFATFTPLLQLLSGASWEVFFNPTNGEEQTNSGLVQE